MFHRKDTTFYLEEPSVFVKEGHYRFTRNPMYLGAVVFMFGLALLLGNLLSLVVAVLFFLALNFICIPPEERIMADTFGEDYLNYKREVRRWI